MQVPTFLPSTCQNIFFQIESQVLGGGAHARPAVRLIKGPQLWGPALFGTGGQRPVPLISKQRAESREPETSARGGKRAGHSSEPGAKLWVREPTRGHRSGRAPGGRQGVQDLPWVAQGRLRPQSPWEVNLEEDREELWGDPWRGAQPLQGSGWRGLGKVPGKGAI